MVLTAATGSVTASGTLLPYLASSFSMRNGGSFLITASPAIITIPQGASSTTTISVTSINSFTGTVTLSTLFTNGSLPAVFSNNPLAVSRNGVAKTVLNVTIPLTSARGGYGIIVSGTTGGSKKVSSTLVSVEVVPRADFSIYAYPYQVVDIVGSRNSTTIIITSLNRFNGTVDLSATIPFGFLGVIGGTNPISLNSGETGTTTLQVYTTTAAVPGVYNITVTGTDGQQSHSCTIMVYIEDPIIESITLTSFTFVSPTNLTLNLRNTGNSTVTPVEYTVRDFAGDAWTLTGWQGPAITPGSVGPAIVLIGPSCPNCIYTWVLGLYQQFIPGQTYTIVLTSSRGNQFQFSVTY